MHAEITGNNITITLHDKDYVAHLAKKDVKKEVRITGNLYNVTIKRGSK